MTVEDGRIVLLRPPKHPREGWAAAIEAIGGDEEDWSDWDNASGETLEEDWTWPEDFTWPDEPIVSTYILTALDPVRGSEIAKARPCAVVSSEEMNARLRTVTVVPMSFQAEGISVSIRHQRFGGVSGGPADRSPSFGRPIAADPSLGSARPGHSVALG